MYRTVQLISAALAFFLAPVAGDSTLAHEWSDVHNVRQGRAPAIDADGADSRKYAPDRTVDILHIKIDVTPDFGKRTIAGTTTIELTPIVEPLSELRLDAIDLDVSSVTSSVKISDYSVTDENITITFREAVEPTRRVHVVIAYAAEPKEGLYFRTAEMGYKKEDAHLFTQGESHLGPCWYPNYDYPNERSTSEVVCRVRNTC